MLFHLGKRTHKQQGVTLIELLMVVAINAILTAIAIPQFSANRIRTYNREAEGAIKAQNLYGGLLLRL